MWAWERGGQVIPRQSELSIPLLTQRVWVTGRGVLRGPLAWVASMIAPMVSVRPKAGQPDYGLTGGARSLSAGIGSCRSLCGWVYDTVSQFRQSHLCRHPTTRSPRE